MYVHSGAGTQKHPMHTSLCTFLFYWIANDFENQMLSNFIIIYFYCFITPVPLHKNETFIILSYHFYLSTEQIDINLSVVKYKAEY
jgi:hypothetical protein